MQNVQSNLFTRDDTFFGVCEGLGEDFGFHPNILRLALTLLLFFNPMAAVVAYAGCGVIVLATRLLVPNPKMPQQPVVESEERRDEEEAELDPIPLAA